MNNDNSAFEVFNEKFNYIYKECIYNVKKWVRIDKYYKPWLSKALLKSIRKKHKLYQDRIKYKSDEITLKYKKYKNKLIKILTVTEKLYFSKRFEYSQENIKDTWKEIKI